MIDEMCSQVNSFLEILFSISNLFIKMMIDFNSWLHKCTCNLLRRIRHFGTLFNLFARLFAQLTDIITSLLLTFGDKIKLLFLQTKCDQTFITSTLNDLKWDDKRTCQKISCNIIHVTFWSTYQSKWVRQ